MTPPPQTEHQDSLSESNTDNKCQESTELSDSSAAATSSTFSQPSDSSSDTPAGPPSETPTPTSTPAESAESTLELNRDPSLEAEEARLQALVEMRSELKDRRLEMVNQLRVRMELINQKAELLAIIEAKQKIDEQIENAKNRKSK